MNRADHRPEAGHADEAGALLARAWRAVLGDAPQAEAIRVLTAQWALETNSGHEMYGHNFGGIKASPSAPGKSYRTVEGYGANRRELRARFRVYASAYAGAEDYVRLLATRYPAALARARAADVPGFAHALAQGGYFTADPAAYARGLERHFQALGGGSPSGSVNVAPGASLAESALWGLLRALSQSSERA
jgi:hypothetical protein